jgi:hypothetical protein
MAKRLLKYFELKVDEIPEWTVKEYVLFLIEALYSTVFPFIAGMLLVYRRELVWVLMLVFPIYFKMRIDKSKPRKKRIYVR